MTKEIKEKEWTYEDYDLVYTDGKYKAIVKIQEDGCYPHPRDDWDNIGKLVIREHRHYTFPNELDFRWDYYDNDWVDCYGDKVENQFEKIAEDYYIFWIDMYEHSGIVFSMLGEGMNCRFDTSRGIGFRAIPKKYNGYDLEEIHRTKYKPEDEGKYYVTELTLEQAEEIARGELDDWNKYCSGEIYEYSVYESVKWTSEKGEERYSWDWVDGCSGYYDEDQAKEEAVAVIESEKK